jgi:hypothetical protein
MSTVTSSADSGQGSLREALASAQPGETITFAPSLANQTITLTSGQLEITENLTIDGANAPGLTISGNNASRVFFVRLDPNFNPLNVTLRNLIVANGRSGGTGEEGVGGGIRTSNDTNLTVENTVWRNNVATGDGGGAIWGAFRSDTTVINSEFDGNDGTSGTSFGAGAIAIDSEGSLAVRDSEFTNNRGTNGGAINTLLGGLTVENSTFINNDSTAGGPLGPDTRGYGGAIFSDGASPTPDARDSGTIEIRNSRFEGNRGAGQGGGLFLFVYEGDRVIIEDTAIINNELIRDSRGDSLGGGLRQGHGEFTLRNTTIANNSALQQGGGLWVGETSQVTISDSSFSGNRADDSNGGGLGGAIALINGDSPVEISNTTIADNFAGDFAGAIFSGNETPVTVSDSTFSNNRAGDPSRIDQQTNRELTDGGNNVQFPGKLTDAGDDNNVTANITIAPPSDLGEVIDFPDSVTGSVPADIIVNRNAGFDNSFGFYAVDDLTGRIGNLNPGDPGYAEAAVSGRVNLAAGLPAGELLAPFIIADGTPEEFLADNPDNEQGEGVLAYFAYLGANPDGFDHIRLQENNVFGFEDLFGGGDADFNDLVVQVNFA